ncbi:hypothetical protein [Kitasatospora sp. NPDC001132]
MTPDQILAAGIIHICTPGRHVGWDHDIQADLDERDAADLAAADADFGTDEWRRACIRRIGAETRIGTALGIGHRTRIVRW